MGIGFELVAAIMIGIYGSQALEEKYQTKGLITLAILLVILAGWLLHIIYLLKKIQKKDEKPK